MKRKLSIKIIGIGSVIFLICLNFCLGQENKEVTIGKQVWAKNNLDVSIFRNGDSIPEAKTAEEWEQAGKNNQPAWCYYNNDQKNSNLYGKLYNFAAVNDPRGLAPEGYHIPTDKEWSKLMNFLGGKSEAGTKMKFTDFWLNGGNGTDESGFSGFPGGCRLFNGEFISFSEFGFWWSSTEFITSESWGIDLHSTNGILDLGTFSVKGGSSVRCIKDK